MTDLSIAVDINTPLTRDEAREYCLNQGTGIYYTSNGREVEDDAINWLLNHPRPHQAREAVRRNLDIIDFDEWQAIENVLLTNSPDCNTSELIPLDTAFKINSVLWEDLDLSPMELEPSYEERAKKMYKLELSFSYLNEAGESTDIQDDISAAADTIDEVNNSIESLIWAAIDRHSELDNTDVIVNKTIVKGDIYIDSDDFTIRTNVVRTQKSLFFRVLRDCSSYQVIN